MTTYRIATLNDLLALPVEKRARCLRDIKLAREVALFAGVAVPNVAYEWTDDDDASASLRDEKGDAFLTLKVEKVGA